MIRATGQLGDGRPMLLIGLSRGNTQLLLEGKPIAVEMKELIGVDAVLVIVGGETEADIERDIVRDARSVGAAVIAGDS